jgi:aspartate dehydrogenase
VKRIGIIGCGVIGTLIAKAIKDGTVKCDELILYDYNHQKPESLRKLLRINIKTVESVEEMIRTQPSVIVEAASQEAVRQYLSRILVENIEVIVMSVGALLGMDLKSNRLHIPSGAIGGLDAISSAALAGIREVTLTTRKNPHAFDMDNQEKKMLYQGAAEEAVKLFPKEMNVAATLALTVQPQKVKVKVMSDPDVQRNVHEIKVVWEHGEMFFRLENEPHPENPGTSALAAWSAIKLLRDLVDKTP